MVWESDAISAPASTVRFAEERRAVFANSSARRYPAAEDEARELLAGQLASPVEFMNEIRNMHEFGFNGENVARRAEVLARRIRTEHAEADLAL